MVCTLYRSACKTCGYVLPGSRQELGAAAEHALSQFNMCIDCFDGYTIMNTNRDCTGVCVNEITQYHDPADALTDTSSTCLCPPSSKEITMPVIMAL